MYNYVYIYIYTYAYIYIYLHMHINLNTCIIYILAVFIVSPVQKLGFEDFDQRLWLHEQSLELRGRTTASRWKTGASES